jgi:glutathione synthase/RimK-type ligase-like ATP-grasp enzyme
MITPTADPWIVYSDGYYLDHRALGFGRRRDFFRAWLELHQRGVDSGSIGRVVNAPWVEARTLKSWFATLDAQAFRVIPTYRFSSIDEVYDFQKDRGAVVAKLDWGGAGSGAKRLLNEDAVRRFHAELAADDDRDLADYCFQPYLPADEKRLWFVGGRCVAGRRSHGRPTPWSDRADDYAVRPYDDSCGREFRADVAAAEQLCRFAGLEVGSIDFIGDRINEINGAGTIFTEYERWKCIVDARPALAQHCVDLLKSLP